MHTPIKRAFYRHCIFNRPSLHLKRLTAEMVAHMKASHAYTHAPTSPHNYTLPGIYTIHKD